MDNVVTTLAPYFLIGSYLAGNNDNHKIADGFEIRPDQIWAMELAALERLEKSL